MDPQRHGVEIGPEPGEDHDLAVEHNAFRLDALDRRHQLGEVASQWFLVAAVDDDLVAVFESDGAEAIPFRLVLPGVAAGQLRQYLRLHRTEWRHDS